MFKEDYAEEVLPLWLQHCGRRKLSSWEELGNLVFNGMPSEASRHEDKIFAFFGMINNVSVEGLVANYNLSVEQVYTGIAAFLVPKAHSNEINLSPEFRPVCIQPNPSDQRSQPIPEVVLGRTGSLIIHGYRIRTNGSKFGYGCICYSGFKIGVESQISFDSTKDIIMLPCIQGSEPYALHLRRADVRHDSSNEAPRFPLPFRPYLNRDCVNDFTSAIETKADLRHIISHNRTLSHEWFIAFQEMKSSVKMLCRDISESTSIPLEIGSLDQYYKSQITQLEEATQKLRYEFDWGKYYETLYEGPFSVSFCFYKDHYKAKETYRLLYTHDITVVFNKIGSNIKQGVSALQSDFSSYGGKPAEIIEEAIEYLIGDWERFEGIAVPRLGTTRNKVQRRLDRIRLRPSLEPMFTFIITGNYEEFIII
ncbi:hypothetical protein F4814DRAFT_452680 [Daldinia grandis]|nr:hypothetical protein F4814DRAFT_452680 [Daldinia grandis]